MDKCIIEVSDAKKELGFKGKTAEFKKSRELVDYCIKNNKIVRITHPTQMNMEYFDDYFNHLLKLSRAYVKSEGFSNWEEFISQDEVHKSKKILHEFGVKAELFEEVEEEDEDDEELITTYDLWKLAQIHYSFKGSELSFKKYLQRQYGSVAEYCLAKDLPINATKWESAETAMRVAKKIGSIEGIAEKSKSLLKYLESEDLLKQIKFSEGSVDDLIATLTEIIWAEGNKKKDAIKEKWFLSDYKILEKENLKTVTKKLKSSLTPEELGILYFDLVSVFDSPEDASDEEKKTTQLIDKAWRAAMVPYAEQALNFKKNPFNPNSIVSAIGYILFRAVSVDGHIHIEEIKSIKNGLKGWKDYNSRQILASINFCLHSCYDKTFFGLENLLSLDESINISLENCSKFLLENSELNLYRKLIEEVENVIQSDGVVHEKEQELLNNLNSYIFKFRNSA